MLCGKGRLNLSTHPLFKRRPCLSEISSKELGNSNTRKRNPSFDHDCIFPLVKFCFCYLYNIIYSTNSQNHFSNSLLSFLFQILSYNYIFAHLKFTPSFLSSHNLLSRLFLTWRCRLTHSDGVESFNFLNVVNS